MSADGTCHAHGCYEPASSPHWYHGPIERLWDHQADGFLRRARSGRLEPWEPRPRGVKPDQDREQVKCMIHPLVGMTREERREAERARAEHTDACAYCGSDDYVYDADGLRPLSRENNDG